MAKISTGEEKLNVIIHQGNEKQQGNKLLLNTH